MPRRNDSKRTEHTRSGVTTRNDATDLGVAMAPPAADDPAPQGPEDALEPNTRGDYSTRLGANYQPHQIVADPDADLDKPQVRKSRQR